MYRQLKFDHTYRKKVRELLSEGFMIGSSGRLEPIRPKGTVGSPWAFTNFDARRKFCSHWNHVYCSKFDLIPRFCRFNCWKTVVYPRCVSELLQLADILRSLNLPSKCGSDLREYTYAAWGGYIYGDTLEQGREYYAQIREVVDKVMSPDVRIILKRGCTEMERLRPSNEWDDYTEDEKALEFQLDDLFHFAEIDFTQAAWNIRDVKEGWILRAISIGDPSVEQALADYSHGTKLADLIVQSVTYHEVPKPQEKAPSTKKKVKGKKNVKHNKAH